MSESLVEKIRQSRKGTVLVNGFTFTFTRPTDIQIATLYSETGGNYNKFEVAKRFVTGWTLKESDVIEGGGKALAEFSDDLFVEWLADARDFWAPLYEAIMQSYVDHSADKEAVTKN